MSAAWACSGILFTVLLTVLSTKFVYIFGLVPLKCGTNTWERQILGWNTFILFALCLVGRVAIFLQTRKLLRNSTVDRTVDTQLGKPAKPSEMRRNTSELRTRQMEMEAIKSLATGVTSLILLSCPAMIFITSMNICRCFSTVQRCSQYAWLAIFVRNLYQLYGIYHPVLYLGWNKEFCHVLRIPLSRMASRLMPSTRSPINVTRLPPVWLGRVHY